MKAQLNQEFIFETKLWQMTDETGQSSTDLLRDSFSDLLIQEMDTQHFSNSFMWEELEGVNNFIASAGY